jgi:hypothetical protein
MALDRIGVCQNSNFRHRWEILCVYVLDDEKGGAVVLDNPDPVDEAPYSYSESYENYGSERSRVGRATSYPVSAAA